MPAILSLLLPIFLLIVLGYAAVRSGFVARGFIGGLGHFVFNFALPALVLRALIGQDLSRTFNWNYVAAYAAASVAVLLGTLLLLRRGLRRPQTRAAIAALGGAFSNSGFVGFPVASLAIGGAALTALPLSMVVENVLIMPLALALAEMGRGEGKGLAALVGDAVLRLARMPLIWAIAAGVVLSASGVQLPAPVATTVGLLADASLATALFVVGGTLAGLDAGAWSGDIPVIMVAKLIVHPLLVWGLFVAVGGIPPDLMAAGVVLAAAPMLTVYPILGQRFGLEAQCSAALIVTTLAGLATMTALVAVMGGAGAMDIAAADAALSAWQR